MNRTFLKTIKAKKWLQYFMAFLLAFTLAGCGVTQETTPEQAGNGTEANGMINETPEESSDKSSGKQAGGITEDEIQENETQEHSAETDITSEDAEDLSEEGTYTSKDDVARYIYLYGHLPSNFITKKEAQALGWEGGSLEPYAPGKCIGGSHFGNYEGILPEKAGRSYTECDIDTLGADKRGAKRIVFSNDGLIYYTENHYESFELLYGDE